MEIEKQNCFKVACFICLRKGNFSGTVMCWFSPFWVSTSGSYKLAVILYFCSTMVSKTVMWGTSTCTAFCNSSAQHRSDPWLVRNQCSLIWLLFNGHGGARKEAEACRNERNCQELKPDLFGLHLNCCCCHALMYLLQVPSFSGHHRSDFCCFTSWLSTFTHQHSLLSLISTLPVIANIAKIPS